MPLLKVANFLRPIDSDREGKAFRCQVRCGVRDIDDVLLLFQWDDNAVVFMNSVPGLSNQVQVDYRADKSEIGGWLRQQCIEHGARWMAIDPKFQEERVIVDAVYDVRENLNKQ